MKCFEYIQMIYDGSLTELCRLGAHGWHVVGIVDGKFILERELIHEADIKYTRDYYGAGPGTGENVNEKK